MIEEIKKEIEQSKCIFDIKYFKNDNINDYELIGKGISLVKLFEILDKYNNQPDYKSAWEELKTNEMAVDKISLDIIQELEQKYNLGGE